jgi:hypothetical protein
MSMWKLRRAKILVLTAPPFGRDSHGQRIDAL